MIIFIFLCLTPRRNRDIFLDKLGVWMNCGTLEFSLICFILGLRRVQKWGYLTSNFSVAHIYEMFGEKVYNEKNLPTWGIYIIKISNRLFRLFSNTIKNKSGSNNLPYGSLFKFFRKIKLYFSKICVRKVFTYKE